jgi:hypothetical protein
MKRYDIGEYDSGMIPHNNGDWVKYEDVRELEELNREMVELLKELPDSMLKSSSPYCPYCHNDLIMGHDSDCRYISILAKVAEVQGE